MRSFNTHYSEAHKVELAVAIRRAAAEVVVLPETSAEYGQAVADLLPQRILLGVSEPWL